MKLTIPQIKALQSLQAKYLAEQGGGKSHLCVYGHCTTDFSITLPMARRLRDAGLVTIKWQTHFEYKRKGVAHKFSTGLATITEAGLFELEIL